MKSCLKTKDKTLLIFLDNSCLLVCVCMFMCVHEHALAGDSEADEGAGFSGVGVTSGIVCCWGWKLSSGLLQG